MHFEQGGSMPRQCIICDRQGRMLCGVVPIMRRLLSLCRGLGLLLVLPDTLERTRQELALQIALGQSLIATKSFGDAEVELVYAACARVVSKQ